MTPSERRFLVSPEGRRLLQDASAGGDPLALQERLRRGYPADRVRLAVEQADLRRRAAAKFDRAADMLFDREALEQASAGLVAAYRAERYRGAGHVGDICCGIGGDAIALAAVSDVFAVDLDPGRVALAQWNAGIHGLRIRPVCADASRWLPRAGALWMDPSRRSSGTRRIALADYSPSVDLPGLLKVTADVGIKVAPGLPHAHIPAGCEAEFLSVHGECRELVLWFGRLRAGASPRATLLPSGRSLEAAPGEPATVGPVGSYLYEPDRAVIRAHLIDRLAREIGAWKLSEDVAYLSAREAVETPFARRFRVVETFPFSLKRLRGFVRDREIGRLDIKKRHFPMTPEALRVALRPRGDASATLVLTRLSGRATVIVCEAEPRP